MKIIVLGAGAAGIAAGRRLLDAGIEARILEARQRIGGRIWTSDDFAPFPVEFGAEFIHGEHAATHMIATAAGMTPVPVDRYGKLRWSDGGPALALTQLPPERKALIDSLFQAFDLLHEWPAEAIDMGLAEYLRMRGYDNAALQVADILLAQTCCASLELLSCADITRELRADRAGKREYRLREGYAALLQWYAAGLDIQLGAAARIVRQTAGGVTVETDSGVFHGDRCIVTLPVGVLQHGNLRFEPPLSTRKRAAIAAMRVEPATKLIYRFDAPYWDRELTFMAHNGLAARWWTPGYPQADAAVIAAYATTNQARTIDALSEAEAVQVGLRELQRLIGRDGLEKHCINARRIAWSADHHAHGGYAHIPPGAAAARPALAEAEGALHFAGEATVFWSNPQTVHGAIESGWRAADEAGASRYL